MKEAKMSKLISTTWLGYGLVCIVAMTGCSSETSTGESTGALSLDLELARGAQIDEVWYNITGNGITPIGGLIDTSAPGATASVEVFGLPQGHGYEVELRAVVDDGTSCRGSASFDVVAGRATPVAVMLNCKPLERFGSVRVNGKLNICAHLANVVVAPLQTSVGSRIDLSSEGADAEGDPIAYFWSASGGPIGNPEDATTTYTCVSPGSQIIQAFVSDDDFNDCIDTWQVEVRCVDGGGGSGGSGGTGGTAGSGGTGGDPLACVPANRQCSNGDIDPIVENPACMLNEPPPLVDGCTGTESIVNPASCTPTGNEATHRVQLLAIAGDCNAGFDLDGCEGNSCRVGGLTQGEGLDGVDNALAALAPLLAGVGGNLGGVDQLFYDGLCDGSIDWTFIVDPNPAENCINVTPVYGGVAMAAIPMNLTDAGCISGTLGTVPLPIADVQGELENTVFRGTGDVTQGFDVLLGATVTDETAIAIAEALLPGAGAVIAQVFDINSDLENEVSSACNALSLSLDVGGTLVSSSAEGACTDASNAAVYADLDYINSRGHASMGTEAASAIADDCVRGSTVSVPPVQGCGDEIFAVIACLGNCPPETVDALATCVGECQQDLIEEITGSQLSTECSACYGDSVACNTAFCIPQCVADTTAPACIACRCESDCIPTFDTCSGLPPTGQCN